MSSTVGFFLDGLTSWDNTPAGSTIMGNGSLASFQAPINNSGRIFGFSAALDAYGSDLWPLIKDAVNAADSTNRAQNILSAAFPDNLSGRGDSSKWFYSQNFKIGPSDKSNTPANELYAGVAAVLWAFKQVYPDIHSIPVFDSYYVKSLGVFDVRSINALLNPLKLNTIPSNPRQGGQWNFISTLYYNGLVDGFIADNYTVGTEGKIPVDSLPFYNQEPPIPYLLQSNYSKLLEEATLPIQSSYQGVLPLNASIYFGDGPSKPFDPASFLIPTQTPLGQVGVIQGSRDPDQLIGTPAAEDLVARGSDDLVRARAGDDHVSGNGGADRLYGQRGDDVIDGGRGRNKVWGGGGRDTFVFSKKGFTKVQDFNPKQDSVRILGVPDYSVLCKQGDAYFLDGNGNVIGSVRGVSKELNIDHSPLVLA